MDIFEQLHRDHAALLDMIESLQTGRDDETVQALRKELTAHLAAEEYVLLQRLRDVRQARALVDEVTDGHKRARSSMSKVFLAEGDGAWTPAVDDLRATMERIVRQEEEKLFPVARDVLQSDDADLLVKRYRDARREYGA